MNPTSSLEMRPDFKIMPRSFSPVPECSTLDAARGCFCVAGDK